MAMTSAGPRGGAWLLGPAAAAFTPEQLSEEHRLVGRTAGDFVVNEVLPSVERLEEKDWTLARALVRRCAELGLVGVNVPEAFGGVELDKVSSVIVSERMGLSASFGAAYGAQANLCVLPILMFGTEEQKARYLPPLVNGDLIGAYALSEAGAGSDALGGQARAVRSPDGTYRLTGEKMWITNGGFADVFIVFARVDGEQFTAFIVERAFGGVTSGNEEHKMGLHGSSTTALLLQDVPVPAGNVLGEIGKGHRVAFNVLNFGRLKLGAMCTGGCRAAIGTAARYAAERRQFGRAIASFGAVRHKLGEMTARTYALEAMMYRTAGAIDAFMEARDGDRSQALLAALEEFAVESSIAKVAGSETLEFVLDESVQIHGGNGFVRDYGVERHYRDARVNRIFEGTNEINRLLIPGMLMKRASRGDLPLAEAAAALRDEIMGPPALTGAGPDSSPLDAGRRTVEACRKLTLFVAGSAMERYGQTLQEEQEVLMWLADMAMEVYAAESALLRASAPEAAVGPGGLGERHVEAAAICANDAALRAEAAGRQALAAMSSGDALRTQLAAVRRLMKITPIDTVSSRRRLADATVARGRYLFE